MGWQAPDSLAPALRVAGLCFGNELSFPFFLCPSGRPEGVGGGGTHGLTAGDTQPTDVSAANRCRLADDRLQPLVGRRSAEVRAYRRLTTYFVGLKDSPASGVCRQQHCNSHRPFKTTAGEIFAFQIWCRNFAPEMFCAMRRGGGGGAAKIFLLSGGAGEYCASPLCPFDLLPSPEIEESHCGAHYLQVDCPYPAALAALPKGGKTWPSLRNTPPPRIRREDPIASPGRQNYLRHIQGLPHGVHEPLPQRLHGLAHQRFDGVLVPPERRLDGPDGLPGHQHLPGAREVRQPAGHAQRVPVVLRPLLRELQPHVPLVHPHGHAGAAPHDAARPGVVPGAHAAALQQRVRPRCHHQRVLHLLRPLERGGRGREDGPSGVARAEGLVAPVLGQQRSGDGGAAWEGRTGETQGRRVFSECSSLDQYVCRLVPPPLPPLLQQRQKNWKWRKQHPLMALLPIFAPPFSTRGWGGGGGLCGDHFAGKISEAEKFATLANPKAHTTSRTHCTAKAPTFRQGKITSQRLLDQSQAGVYMGKTPHTPPFWPFWAYSRTLPQGVELLV